MKSVTSSELTRADAGPAPMGASRARVLAVLRDADAPAAVTDIARQVGLHPNTVRFHLDALIEAGVAERADEQRKHPGRPRAVYTARADAEPTGRRSYRLLAEILASYLAAKDPQPRQAARQAGHAWGRYLADRPPPFRQLDADAATDTLVRALDEIGFAPEATTTDEQRQVLLHHCPFRETATAHQDVVCSVHLGLMQGVLAELDAPIGTERLDPFVAPDLCVAHLRRTS